MVGQPPSPWLPALLLQVVHGGGNDVLWLQRDFGLYLVNCFDTEKACQVRRLLQGQQAGYCRAQMASLCASCPRASQKGRLLCSSLATTPLQASSTFGCCQQPRPPRPRSCPGAGLPPALAGLPAAALLRHQGGQEPGAAGGLAPAVRGDGQLATA